NLSGNYCLVANIDATATANWNGGAGFIPIGDPSHPFNGVFDGMGMTINGLVIKSTVLYAGLFAYVGSSGVVKNVSLTNANIQGISQQGSLAGVLAGYSTGSIVNSASTGTVQSSANLGGVGGLIGEADFGQVTSSFSAVNVSGSGFNSRTGGLVGASD